MDWKDKGFLDLAEIQRDVLRKRGIRMSFDCYNMITGRDGQTAKCKLGKTTTQDIQFILLGKCCYGCGVCEHYDCGS